MKEPTTIKERFVDKVFYGSPCGCHWWIGAINNDGYGYLMITGKNKSAHRLSYELYKGLIPAGLCVCHSCDNRLCVNPDHLWLGSHSDNIGDMVKKGRQKRTANHVKLTPSQVSEIRLMLKGGIKGAVIAKKFNTHNSNIYSMKSEKTWKTLL